MTRKMIINAVDQEEVRIAILSDRRLQDFDIETRGVEKNKGNIYKGVVMAVEPALNAAFVNYGVDKQGFLTANDVHPKYARGDKGAAENRGDRQLKIHELLRPKQTVLVQVSKDEVSTKGAVLTTYLSLAGRYLVLMPDSETQGVSRKIDDEETRKRVREAAARLVVPENMGVIVRTAGRDRTRLELNRDLRVLLRLWDNILRESNSQRAPALIFKEQDVVIRALRDYFSPDIDEIVLDSDEAYDRAAEYVHMVMPNHRSALTRYVERRPIFNHYCIEEQLDVIYTPKVHLPSGGSIVIESTEALVAIDVNSGKQKSGNQEETATETNTDAAKEIARQLRLRDLGGIIVIDFIDMAARKNQQKIERALKEALAEDKARIKVGKISRNGTLEITRQRLRSALNASVFDICHTCSGTGHTLNPSSHALAVLRKFSDRASRGDLLSAKVRVEPEVANRLRTEMWHSVQDIEKRFGVRIDIVAEHGFSASEDDFTFATNPHAEAQELAEPNFGPAPRPEFYDDDDNTQPDVWADEDLSEEDLRALEELDRQDAERAAMQQDADASELSADDLPRKKKRRTRKKVGDQNDDATDTPTRGRRIKAARAADPVARAEDLLGHGLDMPTHSFIDATKLRAPKRPLRAFDDETMQEQVSVDNNSRGGRQRNRGGKAKPQAEIIDAVDILRSMPKTERQRSTENQLQKSSNKKPLWRRLLGL